MRGGSRSDEEESNNHEKRRDQMESLGKHKVYEVCTHWYIKAGRKIPEGEWPFFCLRGWQEKIVRMVKERTIVVTLKV